jgi:hypothetical protein
MAKLDVDANSSISTDFTGCRSAYFYTHDSTGARSIQCGYSCCHTIGQTSFRSVDAVRCFSLPSDLVVSSLQSRLSLHRIHGRSDQRTPSALVTVLAIQSRPGQDLLGNVAATFYFGSVDQF